MNVKIVYLYDEKTFEFKGEYSAQASPMEPEVRDEENNIIQEQKYIEPHHSTEIEPPKFGNNEIPVFHVELDAWAIKPDFRGEEYFHAETLAQVAIEHIGEVDSSLIHASHIKVIRAQKEAQLKYECLMQIISGFNSKALGEKYQYRSNAQDQSNLAMAASILDDKFSCKIRCADKDGKWTRREHDAKQIQAVLKDFVAWKESCCDRMESLSNAINEMEDAAQISKVTWKTKVQK